MSKKIKSIKRFYQNYKNFSFSDLTHKVDEEYIDLTVALNDNGSVNEEIKFTADGELEEKNSYSFDANGKLLTHILVYALDNATEKRVLTRNEKGLLTSEIKYYGDDSGESTKYEYNEKDNVSAIIHFDEEGEFVSREELIYNDKDSLIERINYDADKIIISRHTFSVPVDNRIEENEFDASGKIVTKTEIKFDDKGRELQSVQTNPQGKLISSVTNTYDERGNIIKKVYKDFYSKTVNYSYDEKDLLVTQELFDDSGLLLRKNMFEYDDNGNIIAEQTYEMDVSRGGRDKHFGNRYEYEYYE